MHIQFYQSQKFNNLLRIKNKNQIVCKSIQFVSLVFLLIIEYD